MGEWIPNGCTHYKIRRTISGLDITFFWEKYADPTAFPKDAKPISQLSHDLAIEDVCSQMRDKPLESRMKTLDDVTVAEWDKARADLIKKKANETARSEGPESSQMELKKTLLEAADKLMKAARLIA